MTDPKLVLDLLHQRTTRAHHGEGNTAKSLSLSTSDATGEEEKYKEVLSEKYKGYDQKGDDINPGGKETSAKVTACAQTLTQIPCLSGR